MKLALILIVTFVVTVSAICENADVTEIVNLLSIIDRNDTNMNAIPKSSKCNIPNDIEYDELKTKLFDILKNKTNTTSYFSKLLGLASFGNLLLVCSIIVGVFFVISLFKDLILLLGGHFGRILLIILIEYRTIYCLLWGLIILIFYYRYDNHPSYLSWLYIFDWGTPLFGYIIFCLTNFAFHQFELQNMPKNDIQIMLIIIKIINIVFGIEMTIVHQNWLVGSSVIWLCFHCIGFFSQSTGLVFFSGFQDNQSVIESLVLAVCLNALYFCSHYGSIIGELANSIALFKYGITIYGTLIGFLAGLILANKEEYKSSITYIIQNLIMAACCLFSIFIGNIYYIQSYKIYGCVFLFLCSSTIQWHMSQLINNNTIILFLIFANVFGLYKIVTKYPDYFI